MVSDFVKEVTATDNTVHVLILLLMEYGLGLIFTSREDANDYRSLNPSFNGIWSRTHRCGDVQ